MRLSQLGLVIGASIVAMLPPMDRAEAAGCGAAQGSQRSSAGKRQKDCRGRATAVAPLPAQPDPRFAPALLEAPYSEVRVQLNRLVTSPYRATPEYEYLYTSTWADRSPPPIRTVRYRADNTALLAAAPAQEVTAWAYRWTRAPSYQVAVGAARGPSLVNEAAAPRKPGQKIDSTLKSAPLLPADGKAPWRMSSGFEDLQLGAAIQPAPWPDSGARRQ